MAVVDRTVILFFVPAKNTFPPQNNGKCSISKLERAINEEGLCCVENRHHIPLTEFDSLQLVMHHDELPTKVKLNLAKTFVSIILNPRTCLTLN